MNIRKKQKSVCVPILPRPVRVPISVQSTHPCRAKFQVISPSEPVSPLAFKVSVFSLLVCLDLRPGWCAQRCSRFRSPKGVIPLVFGTPRGVSLNLNACPGVFTHSPVIAVIFYMHTRHHDSLRKIQEALFSRTDKVSEQTLLIHHR